MRKLGAMLVTLAGASIVMLASQISMLLVETACVFVGLVVMLVGLRAQEEAS